MSLLGLQNKAGSHASIPTDYHSIIVWESDRVCAAVLSLSDGAAEILGVAAVPPIGRESLGAARRGPLDRRLREGPVSGRGHDLALCRGAKSCPIMSP